MIFQTTFYILSDDWKTISYTDFSNNSYARAELLQGKSAFLYRYQWVDARYIVADPDWKANTSSPIIACPDGNPAHP
ncbi:MAG: hypothetical protein R2881_09515 [Eubacteriales bacterium]